MKYINYIWITSFILMNYIYYVFAGEKITNISSPPPAEVAKILQKGGYVIYIRHAKTDRSQADLDPNNLENCETQRNLNDEGRQQAQLIGQAFKSNKIPVEAVFSSPYCRAKDTAKIAFSNFEIAPSLRYLSRAAVEEKPKIREGTRILMAKVPSKGKNLVLISHTSNLKEVSNIWPRQPAVAIVFKPDGQGNFKTVGKIEPDEWKALIK